MQVRRRWAFVVAIVVLILIVVGVKGCESSAQKTSLRDYANRVDGIIGNSEGTRSQLFGALDGAAGRGQSAVQTAVGSALGSARQQLSQAESQSVPSPMTSAQSNLVLALQFRVDGLASIYSQIGPALGTSTAQAATTAIAGAMARFYASDVVYKDYTAPDIASALHAHGIAVGGLDGTTINSGQFLPALGWLQPVFVADRIGSKAPAATGHVNTAGHGTHGHELNAVSVGATTFPPGSTGNTLPASPAPSFIMSITNSGSNVEYDVKCKVSIAGLSDTGTSTIAETTPGETTDCTVTLPTAPTPGTYQVTAEVEPVPGEKNVANNSQSFAVDFTG